MNSRRGRDGQDFSGGGMVQDCKKMGFNGLPDHRTAYYLLEYGGYLGREGESI